MLEDVKKQLLYIFIISLIFLLSSTSIVLFTDPFKSSILLILLFYFSLTCFLVAILTLLFYAIRLRIQDGLHYQRLQAAYREASLLTILIVGSLILSSKQLLFWWIEIVFVLALASIELFFLI